MLDLAILIAFVGASVWMGVRSRRVASRNLGEYFLAGRSLGGWQAGASMAATQFAADTPLVVTGLVATAGIFAVWRFWVYGVAFLLLAFVFASHWRRAGVLTDAELTEIRYSGRGALTLRVFKAFYYGTVINCVIVAMVLKAGLSIAEVFLPWHEWLPAGLFGALQDLTEWSGVIVASGHTDLPPHVATADNFLSFAAILAFVALYSMTGGLRSVVFTDILQFTLALAGTILFAAFAVEDAGGLSGLGERLATLYGEGRAETMLSFVPPVSEALAPFLVVISLQWLFQVNSDGTGYLAQRTMSCRDDAQARIAGVVFAWLQILLRSVPWTLLAVALLVVYPFGPTAASAEGFGAAREFAFIRGADELLPPGVKGLLLVGMLGALASTLDTHMNWGASYWSNDLYARALCGGLLKRKPADRELVLVARLSNLALFVLAFALVPLLDSIQQAWRISLLFGAGVGSVLALRWVWHRINLWSEVAAIACSIALAPLLLYLTGSNAEQEWLRLSVMAGSSTLAAVLAALLAPPTSAETLVAFYRRARPVGFWGPVAERAHERVAAPRRALVGQLLTTALCAASLFACMYGCTRLLLPHPHLGRAPALVALVVGAGLAPVWWRRGFGR